MQRLLIFLLLFLAVVPCFAAPKKILVYDQANPMTRSKATVDDNTSSGSVVASTITVTTATVQGLTSGRIVRVSTGGLLAVVDAPVTSNTMTWNGSVYLWRPFVTSVGLALPVSVFTVTNSPVTYSGTLTGSFNTQTSGTVFAGPETNPSAVPTFRRLVAADLPASAYDGTYLRLDASNDPLTGDLTTEGGISPTLDGVGNLGDISHSWSQIWGSNLFGGSLTLQVPLQPNMGGTGLSSYTQGDLIYINIDGPTPSFIALGKNTNATRYLSNQGTSNNPSWNQVNLANGVTGSLPNANLANSAITIAGVSTPLGGSITETTMLDSIGSTRGMIPYRGASTWNGLAVGAANRALTSDGTDASWTTVPNAALANSTITFTDGAGIGGSGSPTSLGDTYTVSATTATPQFLRMGIGAAADSTIPLLVKKTATLTGTNDIQEIQVTAFNSAARATILWAQTQGSLNLGRFGLEWDGSAAMNFIWRDVYNGGAGSTELMRLTGAGNLGINTAGPDRRLDVLDASNPQLRLSQADASKYVDFQVSSANILTITPQAAGSVNVEADAFVKAGTSTGQIAALGGAININVNTVGNVGTGTDNLLTYSVPANTLAATGDYLHFKMAGVTANTVNTKTITAVFGGSTLITSGAIGISTLDNWEIDGYIIRTSPTTLRCTTTIIVSNTATGASIFTGTTYTAAIETLSGALTLKGTGTATANDDVQQTLMITEWGSAGS